MRTVSPPHIVGIVDPHPEREPCVSADTEEQLVAPSKSNECEWQRTSFTTVVAHHSRSPFIPRAAFHQRCQLSGRDPSPPLSFRLGSLHGNLSLVGTRRLFLPSPCSRGGASGLHRCDPLGTLNVPISMGCSADLPFTESATLRLFASIQASNTVCCILLLLLLRRLLTVLATVPIGRLAGQL